MAWSTNFSTYGYSTRYLIFVGFLNTKNTNAERVNLKLDPDVLAAIKPWKEIIDGRGQQTVGTTKVVLLKKPCEWNECHFGNFVTDAFVHYYMQDFTGKSGAQLQEPVIALLNAGSLRANLKPGRTLNLDLIFVFLLMVTQAILKNCSNFIQ